MFFTQLETERILLKNISRADREFVYRQFSDGEVSRFLFDAEQLLSVAEADELIRGYTRSEPRTRHRWVLVRKQDGEKLGTCGFHSWKAAQGTVETGYDLYPDFWGYGYMAEAMRAVLRFAAAQMRVRRVDAEIYPENARSVSLAEKLGFTFRGVTHTLIFRDKPYLHHIYTMDLDPVSLV